MAHLTHDIKGHLAAIQSCLGVAATETLTGSAAEFVALHGETISFSSQLGCGTTFRIVLPLVPGESACPEPAPTPAGTANR